MTPAALTVDARHERCPLPVIRAATAARDAPPGTLLTVWWTDPAAEHDLPAWARMRGHDVLATTPLPAAGAPDDDAPPAAGAGGASVVRSDDVPAWATTVRLGGAPP